MTTNTDLEKYRPKLNISKVFAFTTRHPGLAIFLVYATVAVAGFIYLLTFYSHFNLEVTVYLEIGDILVAGIKDPMVMLMVAGAFSMVLLMWGIVYIQAPFSAWLDRKFDKGILRFIPFLAGVQSVRSFWWTACIILTLYFHMFISIHSNNKAKSIIDEKQALVIVKSEAATAPEYSLLGTTINYVFLYDHLSKHTLILPIESVNSIEHTKRVKEATPPVVTDSD